MDTENELLKKESLKKEDRNEIILDTTKKATVVDQESKTFIAGFLTGVQMKAKSKNLDHS